MIASWLKNALIALLLNALAAYAFNSGSAAPTAPAETVAAPAQACSVPMQLSADATALHTSQPDHNGAQS